jgi:hypothetical protein
VTKITVQKLNKLNTLVIKQQEGRFFIATSDSIIISIPCYVDLLRFLVQNDYVSIKSLEGVIQDVRDT